MEFTEEQQQEIERIVSEQRQEQMIADFGKQFFYVALAYTAALVNKGELPMEVHKMGQVFFEQFKSNASSVEEKT